MLCRLFGRGGLLRLFGLLHRGRRCGRGFRLAGCGCGRGFRRRLGRGLGRLDRLIGRDVHRVFDDLIKLLKRDRGLADHEEAVFDDLRTEAGVAFGVGRVGGDLLTEVLELAHQHECADVFHLAAVLKVHPDPAEAVRRGRLLRRRCCLGRAARLFGRVLALHHRGQPFELVDQGSGVAGGVVVVLHLFDLLLEKVGGLEHQFKNRLRDAVHPAGILADDVEHILHRMGKGGDPFEIHHCGRAFDRMHDPEDCVNIIGVEAF